MKKISIIVFVCGILLAGQMFSQSTSLSEEWISGNVYPISTHLPESNDLQFLKNEIGNKRVSKP